MDILVTGGTVFVSRYIAEYFVHKGHNVFVLNRGSRPQSAGVTPIIADRHILGNTLRGRHFNAVIDVTAYNAEDVSDLLDSLDSFDSYILISSSAVYPETLPQPFKEKDKCGENSIWGRYGTDKIAAEKVLFSRFPDAHVLRPPYLCGPMNNLHREAFVFECAEQNRNFYLPPNGEMKLQFLHIGDLCCLIEAIMDKKPAQHILNVGYDTTVSVKKWAELCYSIVGKAPHFEYVTEDIPQRSYFPFYDYEYVLDVTAMKAIISELTPLEESLSQSYEWFRNNRNSIVHKPLTEFIDNELRKEKP